MIELLNYPNDIDFLSPLIQQEIYYRLLIAASKVISFGNWWLMAVTPPYCPSYRLAKSAFRRNPSS
nr:AraC family transcriptional regulator N-terminal domain-containing protein [Psychrobacter sp. WY6]